MFGGLIRKRKAKMLSDSENIVLNDSKSRGAWGRAWDVFDKILIDNKCETGAEVGVAYAGHIVNILERCPCVKLLYGIDPYLDYADYDESMNQGQRLFDNLHKYVLAKTGRFGNRYTHIRKTSVDAAKHIDDCSLDFIFIDANHVYEYVKEDIAAWMPKVRTGGIVGGHDYNPTAFPGVCHAVNELLVSYKEIFTPGSSVWWTYKED